ncbi:hypothetical protein BGX38DRAFT_1273133 [Terfezia claveryi]|nr:hypothetical protein BGX38DRAFT_1273133 [Terfezia claveryi]
MQTEAADKQTAILADEQQAASSDKKKATSNKLRQEHRHRECHQRRKAGKTWNISHVAKLTSDEDIYWKWRMFRNMLEKVSKSPGGPSSSMVFRFLRRQCSRYSGNAGGGGDIRHNNGASHSRKDLISRANRGYAKMWPEEPRQHKGVKKGGNQVVGKQEAQLVESAQGQSSGRGELIMFSTTQNPGTQLHSTIGRG